MAKVVLASANRVAGTYNSEAQELPGTHDGHTAKAIGLVVYLNITVAGGTTPTLDVKVQKRIPGTTLWIDTTGMAFAQKAIVAQDILAILPGLVEAANKKVADVFGDAYRVVAVVGGGAGANFTFEVLVQEVPLAP